MVVREKDGYDPDYCNHKGDESGESEGDYSLMSTKVNTRVN